MKINRTVELDGEKVHLAKDWLGWRVVHLNRKEDGTINWFNFLFGGKANLLTLILIVIIASIFLFGVNEMVESCRYASNHPEEFCQCAPRIKYIPLNSTSLFKSLNITVRNITS